VLPPTAVEDKSAILDALDALQAGGSTNGEAGIQLAYELAERAFRQDGVNRVVLCTDGDFNVGLTGNSLVEMVEDYRDRDIYLTTLGFGTGNYDDETMEQLADRGNGNYAYIDSPNEALRVLGDKLVSTLQVVAKDVKVQVEFDARSVERWRLIGYENRILDDEDFADDDVDAGDIGAGHNVSALYELELTDTPAMANLAEVRIRYKEPTSDESSEHTWSIHGDKSQGEFTDASDSFRFSAAVTEFAEILRASPYSEGARFGEIIEILSEAAPEAERDLSQAELIELVDAASALY
jgi:Ca-activated chloride channel family protein